MKKPQENKHREHNQISELRAGLKERIGSLLGSVEDQTTAVPGLSLHRRTAPTGRCPATYEPNITVIVQGQKRVELGAKKFLYDESRYLLTSLDLPVVSQVVEASEEIPFLALMLKIEMPMIRDLLSQQEIPSTASDSPAMATGETTAGLLDACRRLVELLDMPEDIPFLSSSIQREILYRILKGPEGARLRTIATLGDQNQRTAKAIAWIKTNYAQPLRVEDLAKISGMAVSTLHHRFLELTAMSPLKYQKQLRLQAARSRMLVDGVDAATAAFEVGYESASQFNREYSRFFGQPPLRDIRALMASSTSSAA
ncbi:MAG: AraC family transcriptional regulator [Acidobacteria bacterium]|nr:AraC family transcriptional regulator [Acidobacteriota bacterium]